MWNKDINKIILASCALCLLFLYQNCGKGFQAKNLINPSCPTNSFQRLSVASTEFPQDRLDLGLEKIGISSSAPTQYENDDFFVVEDRVCLVEKGLSELTQSSYVEAAPTEDIGTRAIKRIKFKAKTQLHDLQQFLDQNPCIRTLARNRELKIQQVPSLTVAAVDPLRASQGHLSRIGYNNAYNFLKGISLPSSQTPIVLAIVDTGVDYNHRDLKDVMWKDSSGRYGYDFYNNDNDPMDDNGHGTHVSGLAGAVANNGVGGVGTFAGPLKIMAIKTMSESGGGDLLTVTRGIEYAVNNGADVINISISGPGSSITIRDSMQNAVNKGITVVIAAGNDGVEISLNNPYMPIMYAKDIQGVIGVGAIYADSAEVTSYSNFSNSLIELGAPGSDSRDLGVLSSVKGPDAYARFHGTSMASPVVAGAAALTLAILRQKGLPSTPADIERSLIGSASIKTSTGAKIKQGRQLNLLNLAKRLGSDGADFSSTSCY